MRSSMVNRRSRRGAVLPLAAVLMVLVVLCAGVVVDMSRAYAQKNELQTAADAAALAGVMELFSDTLGVLAAARYYSGQNEVLHRSLPDASSDLECGVWDDDTRTFIPSDHCGATDNAVSFTIRDTVTFTFPLLLGMSQKQISATARAWIAYVDATKCVKPWAMPYALLTKTLDPANPDTLRELNDYDIEQLKTLSRDERRFMLKLGSPPDAPGNFGSLNIPNPETPANGGQLYRYNIATCNPGRLGRDSVVFTQTGNMVGPTMQGARELCSPLTPQGGGACMDGDGNLGVSVIAALWSSIEPLGGTSRVTIKQLVSFTLDTVSADAEIIGYFTAGTYGGSVGNYRSTIQRPLLVD